MCFSELIFSKFLTSHYWVIAFYCLCRFFFSIVSPLVSCFLLAFSFHEYHTLYALVNPFFFPQPSLVSCTWFSLASPLSALYCVCLLLQCFSKWNICVQCTNPSPLLGAPMRTTARSCVSGWASVIFLPIPLSIMSLFNPVLAMILVKPTFLFSPLAFNFDDLCAGFRCVPYSRTPDCAARNYLLLRTTICSSYYIKFFVWHIYCLVSHFDKVQPLFSEFLFHCCFLCITCL